MMTNKELADAFSKTMKGDLSPAEFARQAMEYMKSPEYMRWKAAEASKDLKAWREGREYLLTLIEEEKKAGTAIDYEIVKLREGHDSLCVLLNGQRAVCFPSFFSKEGVDMNWKDVMDAKKRQRACGNADCSTSTSIDDVTLTFGRGDLDEHGYWEIPCALCAAAYQKDHLNQPVWPVKDAPQ